MRAPLSVFCFRDKNVCEEMADEEKQSKNCGCGDVPA